MAAVKVGYYGGAGTSRDIQKKPKTLVSIDVWSTYNGDGGDINGIRFSYDDVDGNRHTIPNDYAAWGNTNGRHNEVRNIQGNEQVIQLEGTTADGHVTSLRFTSNLETYGWYGDNSGKGVGFVLPLEEAAVVAFFGRSGDGDNAKLNAIGAYVAGV